MEKEKRVEKFAMYSIKENEQINKKERNRVHWICSSIIGENILDISNFQGRNAIVLGKEGKKVLGLFSSDELLDVAKKNLDKEDELTQGRVDFQKGNFMLYDIHEEYDTIILGDVIEHVSDVTSFFNKALSLVKDNGRLVVTSTFGINEYFDYNKTFYLHDFLRLQSEKLKIIDIEYRGKWIGIVYQKSVKQNNLEMDENLLKHFERAIFFVEKEIIDKHNILKRNMSLLSNELMELKKTNESIIENLDYKRMFLQEKQEKIKIQKELIEQYNREELLIYEQNEFERQYELLQQKYNNLKNSTLGKLTLKYWNLRNRRGKK